MGLNIVSDHPQYLVVLFLAQLEPVPRHANLLGRLYRRAWILTVWALSPCLGRNRVDL